MSQVLSPLSVVNANRSTPIIAEKRGFSIHEDVENNFPQTPDGIPSSPFVEDVPSPTKTWSSTKQRTPKSALANQYTSIPLTENALRENEGLTRAFESGDNNVRTEDVINSRNVGAHGEDDIMSTVAPPAGYAGMDDTCMSAFSAAPRLDMTIFARMRPSPTKLSPIKSSRQPHYNEEALTPRQGGRMTPSTPHRHHHEDSSPSPTPRRPRSNPSGGDTTNLLDFTEQFSAFEKSSSCTQSRSIRPSPHKQPSDLAPGRHTPSPRKHGALSNLLDFDLPPAPTPRSIPSITARELESLKSSFLAQVSSLRATLSGKEVEVSSLKEANGDAERRVGEALEEIRDERGRREVLEAEKKDWEGRDREMQGVLRGVKEEIIRVDHEKDSLAHQLSATVTKLADAEARLAESESRLTGLRASSSASSTEAGAVSDAGTNASTDAAVEAAVTKVAKELHGLYRHKHEEKVKALKKSYEARWERRIRELESKVKDVTKENEDLRLGRDATMSGVIPGTLLPGDKTASEQAGEASEASNELKEQKGQIETLTSELTTLRTTNSSLQTQLAHAHLEMADLVAATEELISLSASSSSHPQTTTNSNHSNSDEDITRPQLTTSTTEPNFRGSFSRSISGGSGLRPPVVGSSGGVGESRIGRGGFGGFGAKSMMSNIERMGRGTGSGRGI